MISSRYSDSDLLEFKKIILARMERAKEDLELQKKAFRNDSDNGTNDTSPSFKGYDEGSETMSKESNAQMAIRQEKMIRELKYALIRIENKTYGICRDKGKLISKERLRAVPHATLCIDAKKSQK